MLFLWMVNRMFATVGQSNSGVRVNFASHLIYGHRNTNRESLNPRFHGSRL